MAGSASTPNTFATQVGQVPAAQLDANWTALVNYINTREVSSGTLAARPNTPSAGTWYFANDQNGGTLYFAAATGWVQAALPLSSQTVTSFTAPVTITDGSGGGNVDHPFLKYVKTGSATWLTYWQKPANFANSETLTIAPSPATGLQFHLINDPGGQRLAVWDPSNPLPNIPHTGILPTMAVYGDVLIGDIVALASNPMTYFIRANRDIPITSPTQLFSSKGGNADVDGGATFLMYPGKTGGGVVNDGYIQLIAYGMGTGADANEIHLRQRSSSNTVTTRWAMGGAGVLYPKGSDGTLDIGTTGNRVQTLVAKSVQVSAGTSTTVMFVPGVLQLDAAANTGSLADTNENDLKTYTVPANTLATNGDTLRVTMIFTIANNGTTKRIRLYYGGTVLADSTALAFTNEAFEVVVHISRTGASAQNYMFRAMTLGLPSGAWNSALQGSTQSGTIAVSNASGNIIKATSQQGAGAAANDVVQTALIVEYLRKG